MSYYRTVSSGTSYSCLFLFLFVNWRIRRVHHNLADTSNYKIQITMNKETLYCLAFLLCLYGVICPIFVTHRLTNYEIFRKSHIIWTICCYLVAIFLSGKSDDRCCYLSALCWRIQILMILWCQKLPICTRQTAQNMKPLPAAGHRSMPWDDDMLISIWSGYRCNFSSVFHLCLLNKLCK